MEAAFSFFFLDAAFFAILVQFWGWALNHLVRRFEPTASRIDGLRLDRPTKLGGFYVGVDCNCSSHKPVNISTCQSTKLAVMYVYVFYMVRVQPG
jgi:hypothetical protein